MKLSKIKLKNIKPAEYNPRKISDSELEKLSKSLEKFGFVDPIIINLKNNNIIGGHQRYKILIESNADKEFELIERGDIGLLFSTEDITLESDEDEKALNIALNKINGEFDIPKLEIVLQDLKIEDYDLELTGFDDFRLIKSMLNNDSSKDIDNTTVVYLKGRINDLNLMINNLNSMRLYIDSIINDLNSMTNIMNQQIKINS